MKQLAPFEEHHDCVHVSSQSFQSFCFRFLQKIEIHVEERTGAKFCWRFCSDEIELHTGYEQTNKFGVWSVHGSCRWDAESDSNIVLSKPESPERAMRMSTGVTQSLRQGTVTELDTTDNVRHSQVKIQENVQSTETWKRDRVVSPNDSFRQRTAKSMSTTDVKTEFLNMEITHINYVSKGPELFTTEVSKTEIPIFHDEDSNSSWIDKWEEYGDPQVQKLRECWEFVHRHLKLGDGKILRKYWMWVRMTADHRDQVQKWSKAKTRVYSDSVLCLGRMISSEEVAKEKWFIQVSQFKMYCAVNEFYGIDGEAIEFEWKKSQNNILDLIRDP